MSKDLTRRAAETSGAPARMFGGPGFFRGAPAIQRKCAECAAEDRDAEVQPKLAIGAPGDSYEREADRVADRIMSGGSAAPDAPGIGRIQRLASGPGRPSGHPVSQSRIDARRGAGRPLPPGTRQFFEPRLGSDLGGVRVHSDPEAQTMARSIDAKAFTYGRDVYFGQGQYRPETPAGQHLLAHELTHTVQQGATRQVQRAPLEIVHSDLVTVPTQNQRQAAASCDISCGGVSMGTFHAMPLFFHTSRGALSNTAAGANGIGAALHFLRNSTAIPAGNACASGTDWKVIQVINSNEPADARNKEWFVDNNSGATPFYDDIGLQGSGVHNIPAGYADAGQQVDTTKSIYDRPFRSPARMGLVTGKDFFWRAQAHVVRVKAGKDKVLGGISYGFTRAWNAGNNSHDDVAPVAPACRASPSADFVNTLKTDTSTSTYQFET